VGLDDTPGCPVRSFFCSEFASQRDAGEAADRAEHQAFDEELPDEAITSGAERQTYGELALAAGAPRDQRSTVEESHRRQRRGAGAPRERGGGRQRVECDGAGRTARLDAELDDAVGLGVRKRPEENGVDDGKDRRGRADAERGRDDRDGGKFRSAREPECEAGIAAELRERFGHVAILTKYLVKVTKCFMTNMRR
jgi:hypothetical protein